MNRRTRITAAAVTAVAAAGTAGALLIPSAGASTTAAARPHHPVKHTLMFDSVQQHVVEFTTTGVQQDKDTGKGGKVIGYDITQLTMNTTTHAVSMDVAAAFTNGILYGKLQLSDSPVIRGTMTGGTGAFKGARGTIIAKALDPNGAKTAVTVIYYK